MGDRNILEKQIALVTGASSGIGEGIARAMAKAGAIVVVNYASSENKAKNVVDDIVRAGGKAVAIKADVSDEEQVMNMFRKTIAEFGTIDILVSNSGIQKDSALVDMTLSQWQRVIEVNLTGAFLCAREAVKEFIQRGIEPKKSWL